MARSNTQTRLSLDRYAEVMGINPIHFNNLQDGQPAHATHPYWKQHEHEALAGYIAAAEARLRGQLGFDVAPVYREDRIRFLPEVGVDGSWWETELQTPYRQVRAFGSRAVEVIQADAAVVLAEDTATITVTIPADQDPAEVQVFYRAADREPAGVGEQADARWRIRSSSVSVSGTTATLVGSRASFVKPSVMAAETPGDYADDSDFVSAVDVYRVYTDPELPLMLEWDAYKTGSSTDPGSTDTQTGVAYPLDLAQGEFLARPASCVSGVHQWETPLHPSPPDFITACYLAGYPREVNGQLETRLELAVVRLANVLSPDNAIWIADLARSRWHGDRTVPDSLTDPADGKSPFGFSYGALFAWGVVRDLKPPRRRTWLAV